MKNFLNKRIVISICILVITFSCNKTAKNKSLKTKMNSPNIIMILADDLGYGDPQVYNSQSKIPTPNIDKLALEGMQFFDAHTPSSVCSPTRYSLLTGEYAWRTDLKKGVLWSWDKPLIKKNKLTIPKLLKSKNYATACIGKWHLGWRWPGKANAGYVNEHLPIGKNSAKGRRDLWKKIDFSKPLGGGPLEAGFDYYYGDDVPNFSPYVFFENNTITEMPSLLKPENIYGHHGPMAKGWSLEKVMPTITQKAVRYIEDQSKTENPFFLYFALTAPHTPIAPSDEFKGKSKAGLYGDFVNQVDWTVGQIVSTLKKEGLYENTLILFSSDNGSPQRDGTNYSGTVGSVKEKYNHDPGFPYRGLKSDVWEAGHRVPFIATWPEKINAGSKSNQLICLSDVIATLSSILEIPNTEDQMEDSYDISPILFGKEKEVRQDIIHHSGGGTFAIRKNKWKLILGKRSGGFSDRLKKNGTLVNAPVQTIGQLYDMEKDSLETNNLYAEYPEVVDELGGLLKFYQDKGKSNHN